MLDELLVALFMEGAKGFGDIRNLEPLYAVVAIVCFVNWLIYMIGVFSIVRWFDRLLFRRPKRVAAPRIVRVRPVKAENLNNPRNIK